MIATNFPSHLLSLRSRAEIDRPHFLFLLLKADACGSQFALWQRCLEAAQGKLEASCSVLTEASTACVLEEVIAVQKAQTHLEGRVFSHLAY